jgi:hypothetical protein
VKTKYILFDLQALLLLLSFLIFFLHDCTEKSYEGNAPQTSVLELMACVEITHYQKAGCSGFKLKQRKL